MQTIKFGIFSAVDTGVVLQMLCLHLIKRQFVVLCNSALLKSGTNDWWTMNSSYISVRTNTQNSFLRWAWRRWNSSKQGINVKKGFQAQTLALQTLDLIVKFGLTGTAGTWKAQNRKEKT